MGDDGDRIVDARLRVLRAEVPDGIAASFAPLRHRSMVLVELRTADGTVGHGESWVNYPSWAPVERAATLREGVFPLLLGAGAADIAGLHRRLTTALWPVARQWGAPGPVTQAISGVDLALWDLRGRATGTSAGRLLGDRVRDSAPVYASAIGPDAPTDTAAACRRDGHGAVKVKLGFGRRTDEQVLSAVRAAVGPDVALYADANQAWSVAEATAMAPILTGYDVRWIEEPVAGNALADLEDLHRATGLVIATGENLYGRDAFRAYSDSPAVAVLQPDVAKTGGLTEAVAIAGYAGARGKLVIPHLYGGALAYAATLQLAACAPAVTAVEYDVRHNPLRDPLLVDPPRPDRGTVPLPDRPGLGVRLDPAALSRYEVGGFAG
ncbi:MAG: mandelate racemase/muconate lactonizing enzyme family protein [Actinocatenispora sp.]